MRILISIILYLLFIPPSIFSQNIEHLEKKLTTSANWQEEVAIYLSIIDTIAWTGEGLEKGKLYVDKILEICQKQDCQEQVFVAKAYLSELEMNVGNYEIVQDLILPTIEKKKTLSPKTKSLFYEFAGYYYLINGNSTEAISHYLVAQKIIEKNFPLSKRLGKIYYNLGFSYNIDGTNGKSLEFLQKSVDHFVLTDDKEMVLEAKSGLSTLLATDGKYNKAIDILLDCIEIAESDESLETFLTQLYSALMDIYIRNGNYNKAEKIYHYIMPLLYADDISMEEKSIDLWSFHMSFAKLLGKMNRSEEALQYVDSSYVYAKYLNEYVVRITDLRQAGLLVKNENYELAEAQMILLLKNTKSLGNTDAFNAVIVGLFSTIYSKATFQPEKGLKDELLPICR